MSVLRIPTPLRPYAEGASEIEVAAETVGAALENLTEQYPSLRKHLFTEEGDLRSYVNPVSYTHLTLPTNREV